MKGLKTAVLAMVLVFASMTFLVACGVPQVETKSITGISFLDASFEYDGGKKKF